GERGGDAACEQSGHSGGKGGDNRQGKTPATGQYTRAVGKRGMREGRGYEILCHGGNGLRWRARRAATTRGGARGGGDSARSSQGGGASRTRRHPAPGRCHGEREHARADDRR